MQHALARIIAKPYNLRRHLLILPEIQKYCLLKQPFS
jgi:hypothetical protein